MSNPIVEAVDLRKRYVVRHERRQSLKRRLLRILRPYPTEKLWVLKGVSFSVSPGEAVGVIGGNGAGKSTLLRLVAGIIVPTEGDLRVRGRAGGLFELAAGFHPELNGRDNIFLSGALMGYGPRTVNRRLDAIVEFSELGDFIDIPVKTYSSGMALRLGFAIAVAFEPDVLLVDEVLAVADERFQRRAYKELRRLQESGKALLLVSHEMTAIRDMCERAVWLDEGQVQADGEAGDVIDQYLAKYGGNDDA